MPLYDILQSFKGSQDGTMSEDFEAGTRRELSDYLVSCIDPAWAKPAKAPVEIENKAVASDGGQPKMRRGGKGVGK